MASDAKRSRRSSSRPVRSPAAASIARLLDGWPRPVALLDTRLRYVAASARWRAILGAPDATPGRSLMESSATLPARWPDVCARALDGAGEHCPREPLPDGDGGMRWIAWDIEPTRGDDDAVSGVVIALEDVTGRQERDTIGQRRRGADEVLHEREEQLRLALEGARAGMWAFEPASAALTLDKGIRTMLAIASDVEPTLEAFFARIHPDDRERIRASFDRLLDASGDGKWNVEFRAVWPNGQVVWLHGLGCVSTDDDGQVLRVCGLNFDITDRKQAEEERQRSHAALLAHARELAQRERQMRQLATDLTLAEQRARQRLARLLHDELQQVLFGALLRVERFLSPGARSDARSPESLAELKADIEEAIMQARSLSTQLSPPVVDSGGLAAALRWLADTMRGRYGLVVDVSGVSDAEPDGLALKTFVFDAVRELLFNVVKHAGVQQATVESRLGDEDDLVVEVSDAGVGCDVGLVLATSTDDTLLGLGLRTIRERLALLGGELTAASTPGTGTRMRLRVPRRARPVEPESIAESTSGMDADAVAKTPLRILLVDDHTIVRAGLRGMLSLHPGLMVVGEAADGVEAIAQAHALQPDVVLMDVSMPRLGGVAATRRLRAELPAVQIFGLSAHEHGQGLRAMTDAGAIECFTKTESAGRLIERLLVLHAMLQPRAPTGAAAAPGALALQATEPAGNGGTTHDDPHHRDRPPGRRDSRGHRRRPPRRPARTGRNHR